MTPKHIRRIALAGLIASASLAQAQTHVSTYGLADVAIGRFQNPGSAAVNAVESGKMTTSHLGFRGSEDLGGGLSAVFVLEHFFRPDTGTPGRFDGDVYWGRNAYVGFQGAFGSVHVGRITTSLFVNTLVYNPFGDSFGFSPSIRHFFASGTVTGDSAWSDSLRYTSPKFGGVSFTAHVAAGEGNGGHNTGLSAQYGGGPLSVGVAWQNARKGASVADTRTWQLSGAYDFQVAKAFAQYGRVDNETTDNQYKIASLGASVPLGSLGKALVQWGQIDPRHGAKRTTVSIGYDHHLSKRTDVYLVYMNDRISGTGTGNNLGLGMRHRF